MAELGLEVLVPKDELTILKEKFKVSEEKRKLLENKVTKLKEKCKVQEDSVMETERSKLLAEYNLLMSKKKIRKLEKKLFTESKAGRKYKVPGRLPLFSPEMSEAWSERTLTSAALTTQPNQPLETDNVLLNLRAILESGFNLRHVSEIHEARKVDSRESIQDFDNLSSRLKLLQNMSTESIKQNEDKKSQLEVKRKIVSDVKDEILKIRQIMRLKETVHERPLQLETFQIRSFHDVN